MRVTQNTGEWITQFMGHARDHLAERGELFGVQQFGLKYTLGRQVAVDFHSTDPPTVGVEHRPRGPLQHAGRRPQQMDFFTHAGVQVARQVPPSPGEFLRLGHVVGHSRDQSVQCGEPSGLFRSEPCDLHETAVHSLDAVLRVKYHHAFFQPLDYVVELRLRTIAARCCTMRLQQLKRNGGEPAPGFDSAQAPAMPAV